jgi:hypothetical protein
MSLRPGLLSLRTRSRERRRLTRCRERAATGRSSAGLAGRLQRSEGAS